MTETKLIYKKIGEILKEIEPVTKEKTNTQQNYKFRGIEDAMNMLSPILAKHGVFPTTEKVEDVLSENVQSKSGSAGYHYVRRYTFHFYAEDGSFVSTMADGEAIDYGDKSSNKAYSTAYREALWKLFIVPFAADDIENTDHDLKPIEKPVIAKPTVKADPFKVAEDAIKLCTTPEQLSKIAEKVTAHATLTEEQKAELYEMLEARASLI
jgi:hypothetical protein